MAPISKTPVIPPVDPNQNMGVAFLVETFKRITAKSPVFFEWWKIITGVLTLVAAMPDILAIFHITVYNPEWLKLAGMAGAGAHLMTYLTAQGAIVGSTQPDDNLPLPTGTPLKITDASKLPFTAANELKANSSQSNKQ